MSVASVSTISFNKKSVFESIFQNVEDFLVFNLSRCGVQLHNFYFIKRAKRLLNLIYYLFTIYLFIYDLLLLFLLFLYSIFFFIRFNTFVIAVQFLCWASLKLREMHPNVSILRKFYFEIRCNYMAYNLGNFTCTSGYPSLKFD